MIPPIQNTNIFAHFVSVSPHCLLAQGTSMQTRHAALRQKFVPQIFSPFAVPEASVSKYCSIGAYKGIGMLSTLKPIDTEIIYELGFTKLKQIYIED